MATSKLSFYWCYLWGGLLWTAATTLFTVGMAVGGGDALTRLALFVAAIAAAYTVCASVRVALREQADRQREAFDYGREVERMVGVTTLHPRG